MTARRRGLRKASQPWRQASSSEAMADSSGAVASSSGAVALARKACVHRHGRGRAVGVAAGAVHVAGRAGKHAGVVTAPSVQPGAVHAF